MQDDKLYYEEKTESLAYKAGLLIVQYATILRDYVAEPFSHWVCTPGPDISNAAPTKPCHLLASAPGCLPGHELPGARCKCCCSSTLATPELLFGSQLLCCPWFWPIVPDIEGKKEILFISSLRCPVPRGHWIHGSSGVRLDRSR